MPRPQKGAIDRSHRVAQRGSLPQFSSRLRVLNRTGVVDRLAVIGGTSLSEAGDRSSNACTVGGIGFGAIRDVAFLDLRGSSADLAGRILEQSLTLSGVHLPKEVAGLPIVVVVDAMVPVGRRAVDRQGRFVEPRLVGPFAAAIGEVGRCPPEIAIRAHRTVAVIAVERTLR